MKLKERMKRMKSKEYEFVKNNDVVYKIDYNKEYKVLSIVINYNKINGDDLIKIYREMVDRYNMVKKCKK